MTLGYDISVASVSIAKIAEIATPEIPEMLTCQVSIIDTVEDRFETPGQNVFTDSAALAHFIG